MIEFKVYKEHEGGVLEDVTNLYEVSLFNNALNMIHITWINFAKVAEPGKYVILAPKRTGLFMKYATRWKVIVTEKTLKATLKEIYDKESEE